MHIYLLNIVILPTCIHTEHTLLMVKTAFFIKHHTCLVCYFRHCLWNTSFRYQSKCVCVHKWYCNTSKAMANAESWTRTRCPQRVCACRSVWRWGVCVALSHPHVPISALVMFQNNDWKQHMALLPLFENRQWTNSSFGQNWFLCIRLETRQIFQPPTACIYNGNAVSLINQV